MIVDIPNLRYSTASPATVPANETWVVKVITGTGITASITGNSYTLKDWQVGGGDASMSISYNVGGVKGSSLVLKTGDSITGASTIGYWILETDYGLHYTMPNLRQSTGNVTTTGSIVKTVPTGQTWIIKLCNYYFTLTSAGNVSHSIVGSMNINSNIYQNCTISLSGSLGGGSKTYIGAESMIDDTIILKAGDSITVTAAGSNLNAYLYIGYWILEQDF